MYKEADSYINQYSVFENMAIVSINKLEKAHL
jgi:hypothetical protein